MTESARTNKKYPLSRLRSVSLTSLADNVSPSREFGETLKTPLTSYKKKQSKSGIQTEAWFLIENGKMKRKVPSTGCLRLGDDVMVVDIVNVRGKSVDQIDDEMQLKQFAESANYLNRRKSLSSSDIISLADQPDVIREGGKKKKVIQAVQQSLSSLKHRGWKGKSASLGSERSDDPPKEIQNKRSKSVFARSQRKNSDDVLELDDYALKNIVLQTEYHCEKGNESPEDKYSEKFDFIISKIDAIENEMINSEGRSLELKQTLKKIKNEIEDKINQREQLQARFDLQLRRWENFTELHQDEVTTMKTQVVHTVNSMESVEYRVYRRTADLEEHIRNCAATIKEITKQQQNEAGDKVETNGKIIMSKVVGVSVHMFALLFLIISSRNSKLRYFIISLIMIATIMIYLWIMSWC